MIWKLLSIKAFLVSLKFDKFFFKFCDRAASKCQLKIRNKLRMINIQMVTNELEKFIVEYADVFSFGKVNTAAESVIQMFIILNHFVV